jgi:hypothetical protein
MELAYMIDVMRKEGDGIPVTFPKERMVARIDRLLQLPSTKVHPAASNNPDEQPLGMQTVQLPSPLRGRSVFRPDLTDEEFDSLGPEERLRVALLSGQPILKTSQSPAEIKKYEEKQQLFEKGIIVDAPEIRRVRKHYSDYRLVASMIQLRSEEGTRHYAVLLWQAPSPSLTATKTAMPGWQNVDIKVKTRMAAMEAGEARNILGKFHRLLGDELRKVPRLYPVLLTRPINPLTTKFSDLSETMHEEQLMLRLLQQIQPLPPIQLEDRVYYTDLEIQRREREDELNEETTETRTGPKKTVRQNLLQEQPDWDSADLILTQGAVALLVSDSIEELDGLPRQTSAQVLGIVKDPVVVPNLPRTPLGGATLRTGTHSTVVRMTVDELHPAIDVPTIPPFVPEPEILHDEGREIVNWPDDPKLKVKTDSPLPPPLAIRVQQNQILVVLAPGQNAAEMPAFWERGYERNTTRVLRLPNGCHVLPFGETSVCWPTSPRIEPKNLLNLLRGR